MQLIALKRKLFRNFVYCVHELIANNFRLINIHSFLQMSLVMEDFSETNIKIPIMLGELFPNLDVYFVNEILVKLS